MQGFGKLLCPVCESEQSMVIELECLDYVVCRGCSRAIDARTVVSKDHRWRILRYVLSFARFCLRRYGEPDDQVIDASYTIETPEGVKEVVG